MDIDIVRDVMGKNCEPLKDKIDKWVNDPEYKARWSFSYEDVAAAVQWLDRRIQEEKHLATLIEDKRARVETLYAIRKIEKFKDEAFADVIPFDDKSYAKKQEIQCPNCMAWSEVDVVKE